ncbi:polysaccharide lyase family 20 protein [Hypoxylon sp. FL1284]|nr:polysaccharide lyase family 20 protein [Hypoxylon sp. FL1284]
MVRLSIPHALLILLALPITRATQSWHNTGTKSGWTSFTHEHLGTVDEVRDPTYRGATSLRMTQIHDPTYTGRYHSEAVRAAAYRLGDSAFYGFAFRLAADWQFAPARQSFTLAQFIADFADRGCAETWMPGAMLWLEGARLQARVKHGDACPVDAQVTTHFSDVVGEVAAGEWHRVVVQARWRSGGDGFFKLWFDGEKVLERYDIPTTVADPRPFQFRVGLYANGWHDRGYEGTQGTRQVWYDQIAAGSTFKDADPDGWSADEAKRGVAEKAGCATLARQ